MSVTRQPPRKRQGAILGLMAVLLLILSITSLTALQLGRDSRLREIRHTHDITARYAADAGISRTLYLKNRALANGTWNTASLPSFNDEPLIGTDAVFTANVQGSLADGYTITSVGRSRSATRGVRVELELTNPFSMDFAVLTRGSIALDGSTVIQGYNSSDLSQTNLHTNIGSLSDSASSIDIKNNATVTGDVYVGMNADPDEAVQLKARSDIGGELLNHPPPLPELAMPAPPSEYTKIYQGSLTGENFTLNPADSGIYSEITISNNGMVTIEGHCVLVVTGDIRLHNSAEIYITENSSLTIYLEGDLDGDNSAGVRNGTNVPANFKLYGTGTNQQINLKNSMDFHGVIYAPTADMTIFNGADVYGALVVNSFDLKNSGHIYYDVALRQADISDPGAMFRIVRWEEF